MSLQNLANQMQSTGRGGDSMLVHMNPKEVAGLQQLAMAHGGSLTINPETGLPEAGFLSNLLPTIIGAALAATGVGAPAAAMMVGAGTGVMTGSLKKGLMAGLGAFSGAGMAPGIMGASTAAAAVPQSTLAANAVNPAFAPGATFNQAAQTGMLGAPTAAPAAASTSTAFSPAVVRPNSIVAAGDAQRRTVRRSLLSLVGGPRLPAAWAAAGGAESGGARPARPPQAR